MTTSEKTAIEAWLVILLRFAGGFMLLAFGAIFLPTDWMAASHQRLGLGEFPASTLVDYLTRSVSALYGIHGGLYLVIARDVRRYAGVLRYIAAMNIVFGILMVGIGMHAGLPWLWTLVEGPPVAVFGALQLFMLRSIPQD
ncbi:MAG: hypothetical protein AAF657_40930 [Acidobacteriota bacterium]